MALYKGIDVSDDVIDLVRYMDDLDATRESLQSLQAVWDTLALLGQLSGTGVEIGSVREAFGRLTQQLVGQLAREARAKAGQELQIKAQVAIDILVRNLFERTADIGFLATDDDLRAFLDADTTQRDAQRPAIHERLRAYQRKYSVYRDIVLMGPDGTVLARLDEAVQVAVSRDPLVAEAVRSRAPYLEHHRHWDLRPGDARSLVYACRVMSADGLRCVGVLCLCFDFDDECTRIFEGLLGSDDWSVVTLTTARGDVIASSDPLQVPVGARVPVLPHGAPQPLRFAGRRWLASACDATPFQGYGGPGWRGHVMLPLEHAFRHDAPTPHAAIEPKVLEQLGRSPRLCSDALREIAPAAERIEAALTRAVWNGNVALVGADAALGRHAPGAPQQPSASGRDLNFAKTLLREIGRTGSRTRDVFTQAIAAMNRTVLSSVLEAGAARAALAVDIMDRNLYERANDCRWWALTTAFRSALDQPAIDGDTRRALTGILQTIHGLYTVYANLLLFDRTGRIVAVSRADDHAAVGLQLEQDWVARCLALGDPESHVVSAFEPSPLYGGRPTSIYAAAVRGSAGRNVVGGIAIVFDAAPQFEAMLADTAACDAQGQRLADSFGAFVDRSGNVIASLRPDLPAGARLPPELAVAALGGQRGGAGIVRLEGRTYALGACRSAGYREYAGTEAIALSFQLLADARELDAAVGRSALPPRARTAMAASARGDERVDLATFAIGGQWYGLPADNVQEAMDAQHILPLPGTAAHVRGSVMLRGEPVAVLSLDALLGAGRSASLPTTAQIVIVKPQAGRKRFGMLVDALGDNPEVGRAQLDPATSFVAGAAMLVEQLVRPPAGAPAGQDILMLLAPERLGRLLSA